jgi:BNR repeat-like domain
MLRQPLSLPDSLTARAALALAVFLLALMADQSWRAPQAVPAAARMDAANPASPAMEAASLRRVAQGRIPMPEGARAAHASSLLVMPPESPAALTLFWFSGERESGPQVQIAASQLDRISHTWSAPRIVVNRQRMGEQLGHGLRRLGNPVPWRDAQGRVHLFVVATGWGGWAASRILHLQQRGTASPAEALDFEPVGVLPLSWFWNISYLVRNAVLPLQDGGMVLPVHFELGSKVPAQLRFAHDGSFLGAQRISRRDFALQPTLLPQAPQQWLALMRDERPAGHIVVARTRDGGQHWEDAPDLSEPNPDSAIAALLLAPGQMLLAHNPVQSGRAHLQLSYSAEGTRWQPLQTLAKGQSPDEFSYPSMAWADGSLWVVYTLDREVLAWQQFSPGGVKP